MNRWLISQAVCLIALCTNTFAQDVKRVDSLKELAMGIAHSLEQEKWGEVCGHFDTVMQKALPEASLAETWKGVIKQFGGLKSFGQPRYERRGAYDAVIIPCVFENARWELRLVFNDQENISGLFLALAGDYDPPAYAKPDQIKTREVSIGRGLLNLPGTLMLPLTASIDKPVPAVVLVHGSGPQDRDETIGPNKPFLDLAYGLSARGIAVLRYEKRTKYYAVVAAMQLKTITVREETIDDAVEAFEFLRKQKEIDPDRISIIGHSLGGNLIPRIAERTRAAAGYIGLAASARPLEDLILQQTEELAGQGELSAEVRAELEKLRTQVAQVKSPELSKNTPTTDLPLGVPATYWLDLRGYEPAELCKSLSARILLAQGGRDYQVTEDDWSIWKAALSTKPNCTLKYYADLNHQFMTGKGRSKPAEYLSPGHVDVQLIDDLAEWLQK